MINIVCDANQEKGELWLTKQQNPMGFRVTYPS